MAKRLNELSSRTQVLIFGLLSLAVAAVAWQLVIGPARAALAEKQARASGLQAEVVRARLTAAKLPAVQREVNALETSLRRTTAILPDEKDPQDVLRNLHELASETALDISSFTPKSIVTKTQYSEWPIQLGLDGKYHDLGRFMDRVATMARLMSVTDLHIKASTTPASNATISASCTATTFVFNKEVAASAPGNLSARATTPGGQQ